MRLALKLTALIGGAAFAWRVMGATVPVDGYAALVNDQVITTTEVLGAMQPVERQLRQTYRDAELELKLQEAYESALDALIERMSIIDAFKQRKDMALPDTYVNARTEEIVRTRFNNNRAEFMTALQADGLTLEEWKNNLKNSMIVSIMREREVDSKVQVSPQAVREAYDQSADTYRVPPQVELRMIVLHRGTTPEEAALKLKQAEEIRRRLLAGEDFGELAKQISEGPKAAAGGYAGWIDPGTRREELADAINDLDPGEISEVIEAGDELYILKVEGRKNAAVIPFEKVQEDIRNDLQKKEAKRLYDEWINRLKQKAFIRKF